MGNILSNYTPLENDPCVDLSDRNLDGIAEPADKTTILVLNLAFNKIRIMPTDLTSLSKLFLAKNNYKKNLPDQLITSLQSYTKLTLLDLSYNFLNSIPDSIVSLSNLYQLNLDHNNFKSFPVKAQCPNLKYLILSSNELTTQIDVTPFPNLKSLILNNNQIESISLNAPKLTIFLISHNKIHHIDPDINFESLTLLDLSYNNLETIPDLSKTCPQLINFDASHNILSEIPILPSSIKHLYLHHNQIRSIDKNIEQYPSLYLINLQFNCIEKVNALPLSIQTLILTHNEIKEIPESIDTPELISVSLTDNKLIHMPTFVCNLVQDYSFYKNKLIDINLSALCENISTLDLSNNNIEEVPSQLFAFTGLYSLNLSKNKITKISERISVSCLTSLNISENPLQKLPDAFPAALEKLIAANCQLTEIPETYSETIELIELNVSGNKLKELPMMMSLLTLNASHNEFTHFPYLAPTIQKVDISFNAIEAFHESFYYLELTELDISHNRISYFASVNQGKPMIPQLEFLNISCNPIIGVLPTFPKLTKLLALNTKAFKYQQNQDKPEDNFTCITNDPNANQSTLLLNLGAFNTFQSFDDYYHQNKISNHNSSEFFNSGLACRTSEENFSEDSISIFNHFNQLSTNDDAFFFILNANDNDRDPPKFNKMFIDQLRDFTSNRKITEDSLVSNFSTNLLPYLMNPYSPKQSYYALSFIRTNKNTKSSTLFLSRFGDCEIGIFGPDGKKRFMMKSSLSSSFSFGFNHGIAMYGDSLMSDDRMNSFTEADFRAGNGNCLTKHTEDFPPPQNNNKKLHYTPFDKTSNKSMVADVVSHALRPTFKWLIMANSQCFGPLVPPEKLEEILLTENDPFAIASKIKNIVSSNGFNKNISIIVVDLQISPGH